jgi:hypothetical protein
VTLAQLLRELTEFHDIRASRASEQPRKYEKENTNERGNRKLAGSAEAGYGDPS